MTCRMTKLTAAVGAALTLGAGVVAATPASADVPDAWEKKTSTCDTLSFYSENPAYNDGLSPSHLLGGHKKFYFTSGPVVKGWMPVYSLGQPEWHTGWVRQECLVNGWPYSDSGTVIY